MPQELNIWAEIAKYLAVSIRQAQYLEKRSGLPVRRVPGERGRVVAYTNEIDDWKRRRLASPVDEARSATTPTASISAAAPIKRAAAGTFFL